MLQTTMGFFNVNTTKIKKSIGTEGTTTVKKSIETEELPEEVIDYNGQGFSEF